MLVYGKNVARELLKSDTQISKIMVSKDFSDDEIFGLISKKKITLLEKDKKMLKT